MIKAINYVLKTTIMIFFIIISSNYIHPILTKTYTDNVNKTVNLSTMALKVDEFLESDIYSVKDTYTGDLTGYVYNCPLCNGTLGCMPSYNIRDGKNTYIDKTYGEVYIVASSPNLPCGSIVKFDSKRISSSPVIAIVLDRGVPGKDLDFLSPNLEYAIKNVGRSIITYDVLREGFGE